MAGRSRTLTIDITVDDTDARKLTGVGRIADETGNRLGRLGDQAKLALAGIGVAGAVAFTKELLNVAQTAEEVTRRSEVVFGEFRDSVAGWADSFNEAMGVSRSEAEGFAAAVGDILVPMGFAREEAAQLAPELVEVGTALASSAGVDIEQGINAVTSALTGEREALKSLGIVINESSLQGLEGTFQGITGATEQQNTALATMQEIFRQGADSIELFDERQGTMSDTMNELNARIADLKLALAEQLGPAFAGALDEVLKITDAIRIFKLGVQSLWSDDGEEEAIAMIRAMQHIRDALITGGDEVTAFANAVVDMAADVNLTRSDVEDLAFAAGLSAEEIGAAEEAAVSWAEAQRPDLLVEIRRGFIGVGEGARIAQDDIGGLAATTEAEVRAMADAINNAKPSILASFEQLGIDAARAVNAGWSQAQLSLSFDVAYDQAPGAAVGRGGGGSDTVRNGGATIE